jgi:hypothetical protein
LSRAADLPFDANPAFTLAQLVMGLVLFVLVARWSWQVYRRPEAPVLLRGVFLTLAWGWLLSSAPNPWYLTWSLPFMLFAGRRNWFLLPGLALLYYASFWLERSDLRAWQDALVWVEFVPFFAALAIEAVWCRVRVERTETEEPCAASGELQAVCSRS